jgi:hypothetical protein
MIDEYLEVQAEIRKLEWPTSFKGPGHIILSWSIFFR